MCGVSLRNRKTSAELRQRMGVEVITDVVRRGRLPWYGHVVRKEQNDWVKKVTLFNVKGTRPSGRPKKTWKTTVLADMKALCINHDEDMERSWWKKDLKCQETSPTQRWLERGL